MYGSFHAKLYSVGVYGFIPLYNDISTLYGLFNRKVESTGVYSLIYLCNAISTLYEFFVSNLIQMVCLIGSFV